MSPSWCPQKDKGATERLNCPHCASSPLKHPVTESGSSGTKATFLLRLTSRSFWEPVVASELPHGLPSTHSCRSILSFPAILCWSLSMAPLTTRGRWGCFAKPSGSCTACALPNLLLLLHLGLLPSQMLVHLASARANTYSGFRTLSMPTRVRPQHTSPARHQLSCLPHLTVHCWTLSVLSSGGPPCFLHPPPAPSIASFKARQCICAALSSGTSAACPAAP